MHGIFLQMTAFADLDPVINKWVEAAGSQLFDEWAGQPARFFHVPGERPFECFQIVVFQPSGGNVTVQAASIDTNDDAEMVQIWEGPTASLDELLGDAMTTVEQWRQQSS
jgi:hypothetical protein